MRESSTTVLAPFVTNSNTLTTPAQSNNNPLSRPARNGRRGHPCIHPDRRATVPRMGRRTPVRSAPPAAYASRLAEGTFPVRLCSTVWSPSRTSLSSMAPNLVHRSDCLTNTVRQLPIAVRLPHTCSRSSQNAGKYSDVYELFVEKTRHLGRLALLAYRRLHSPKALLNIRTTARPWKKLVRRPVTCWPGL